MLIWPFFSSTMSTIAALVAASRFSIVMTVFGKLDLIDSDSIVDIKVSDSSHARSAGTDAAIGVACQGGLHVSSRGSCRK